MKKTWVKYIVILLFSVVYVCFNGSEILAETTRQCVVIDPAHGGEDGGVVGIDKLMEKDVTLAIAKGVQKELAQEAGLEVILTRDSDKTVSLSERKKKISASKPAIVLSIHVNGGFAKTASGYELYYPGFKDIDQTKKDKKKNQNADYINDTIKLARLVQKNLDKLFPRKGRGLREANTPISEDLQTPVLVVEIGFATNPDEKKKIVKEKTEAEISKALAKSIKTFF